MPIAACRRRNKNVQSAHTIIENIYLVALGSTTDAGKLVQDRDNNLDLRMYIAQHKT